MIRVLISDDEPLARARLRDLLRACPGVAVAGEAADGRETLQLCHRLQPDVVLLDIRMPAMDGLEAAGHLAAQEDPPAVIFVTAYGDHALAAFEAQAVDYLLKPVRLERLQRALARVDRPGRLDGGRLQAIQAATDGPRPRTHLSARFRERLLLVPVADVLYFRADHKYVLVRHRGGEMLIEDSLKSLETEFGDRFLRIHRNALVAAEAIAGMEKAHDGRYRLCLRDCPDRLEISRRHLRALRAHLKALARRA